MDKVPMDKVPGRIRIAQKDVTATSLRMAEFLPKNSGSRFILPILENGCVHSVRRSSNGMTDGMRKNCCERKGLIDSIPRNLAWEWTSANSSLHQGRRDATSARMSSPCERDDDTSKSTVVSRRRKVDGTYFRFDSSLIRIFRNSTGSLWPANPK